MNALETQKAGIAFSRQTELYHRQLSEALKHTFSNQRVDTRISTYQDLSPITLVESADHVLLFAIYEGDNWETTYAHLGVLADAFTASDDVAGPNTSMLGVYFVDFEGRHDRREEKAVADGLQRAIVKSQGVPPRSFARALKANGVEYVVTVNIHSHLIDKIFQKAGLRHIALATEPTLIDKLDAIKYLTDEILDELVIGTTDIGGLKEAVTAKRYIDAKYGKDVPIAIVSAQRIPKGIGQSDKIQQFAWGDVKNKPVLLIDDRSDSVSSIKHAVDIYCKEEAKEIVIYITHAVFANKYYYETIQSILRNPKVKFVFVSNSLPMGEERVSRQGGIDVPYVWENGVNGKRHKKKLEILDIHPFITWSARTLLESATLNEAIGIFSDHHVLLEMRSPHELFEELTQSALPQTQVIAIYHQGQLIPLPLSASSSST